MNCTEETSTVVHARGNNEHWAPFFELFPQIQSIEMHSRGGLTGDSHTLYLYFADVPQRRFDAMLLPPGNPLRELARGLWAEAMPDTPFGQRWVKDHAPASTSTQGS